MFDETRKYKEQGHFFFNSGDNLKDVSKKVPEKPGVYYIVRLAKGKITLVYIGKSESIQQNGLKAKLLNRCINGNHSDISREEYFQQKMVEEQIDALDIYWFVTMDKNHNDLPAFVEGLLLQRVFDWNGMVPEWNVRD